MLLTNQGKLTTAMAVIAVFAIGFITQGQETKTPQAKGGKADAATNGVTKGAVRAADSYGAGDTTQRASLRLKDIEAGNKNLDKNLGVIEELVGSVQPGNFQLESKTINEFKRYAIEFQVVVRKLDGAEGDVRFMKEHLKELMLKTAPDLDRIAAEYEQQAAKEKIPQIQKQYAELAQDVRQQAQDLRRDAEVLDAKVAQILDGLELIRAMGRLASVWERHLSLTPDPNQLQYLDRFMSVLDAQAGQFRKSMQLWREFQDRRRGNGTPPAAGAAPFDPAFPPPGTFPPGVFPEPPAKK